MTTETAPLAPASDAVAPHAPAQVPSRWRRASACGCRLSFSSAGTCGAHWPRQHQARAAASRIAQTLWDLIRSGDLQVHIAATLARVAAGFALGALAGTIIGALAGGSLLVRRVLDPTLQGLRAIPSIAWVPLFILWLGIFEASKIALIAVGFSSRVSRCRRCDFVDRPENS